MQPPVRGEGNLVITNGKGRLFVQTVLPPESRVTFARGEDLYRYGGNAYPPSRNTGPAPACRIEVSPATARETDCFLHVLTATDATTGAVPQATATVTDTAVEVSIGEAKVTFTTARLGGSITLGGKRRGFTTAVIEPRDAPRQGD